MCKFGSDTFTRVKNFPEAVGLIFDWLQSVNSTTKKTDFTQARKYEFPCGEQYEVKVTRIK